MESFDINPGKKIWFNGESKDWNTAEVHVLTHGLHYGTAVFEGERAYNGKVFKLEAHTERLVKSAEDLRLDLGKEYSVKRLMDATEEVVEVNEFPNCYIRPVIWKGSDRMGVDTTGIQTNVAIAAWDDWENREKKPIKLLLEDLFRRPDIKCYPSTTKASGLYSVCALCKRSAHENGCDDALLLCSDGASVAETTAANIFFVKGDHIVTPKADCFLDGITRQTVLELAEELGYSCESDRRVPVEEIWEADEAFVTGTLAEVTQVSCIDVRRGGSKEVKEFKREEVFTKLRDAYDKKVRE